VGWRFEAPPPGQRLLRPEALFKKLDPSIVEEEGRPTGESGVPATEGASGS
jgi:hypothetical protein